MPYHSFAAILLSQHVVPASLLAGQESRCACVWCAQPLLRMEETLACQQMSDRIGGLCAARQPQAHLVGVQPGFGRIGKRVVGPEGIDKTTVAWGTRIRHDDTIEWPFLCSHALQANTYCHCRRVFPDREFSGLKRAWKRQMPPFPFALFLADKSFHQLLRLGKLLQQAIPLFHTRPAAARDTLAPTAI